MRAAVALGAALAVAGCSLRNQPQLLRVGSVAQAAPTPWIKIDAPGFTLITDLSPSRADEAAQEIAAELAGVGAAFGNPAPRFDVKLEVLVWANELDFEQRFGRDKAAATWVDEQQTFHVHLWGTADQWVNHGLEGSVTASGSALRQTLAQRVLLQQIPSRALPRWFFFGMGAYVSTLVWAPDGKAIQLGAVNLPRLRMYRESRSVGFADVTGPKAERPGREQAYARAYEGYCWALIYTAIHQEPDGFASYFAAIAQGETPEANTLFQGLAPEAIDQEVDRFMRAGEGKLRRVPVVTALQDASMAPLSEADVARYVPPPVPQPWQ